MRGEALHDDQVAARGPARVKRGEHRPARADLGRERQPLERPSVAGVVFLPTRQLVARRPIVEAVAVRPLHERRPARRVASIRDVSRRYAGARRDTTPRHAEHLFGLPALAGLVLLRAEQLHHHLTTRRPAPLPARLRRVAEAQRPLLAGLASRRGRGRQHHQPDQHVPAVAEHLGLLNRTCACQLVTAEHRGWAEDVAMEAGCPSRILATPRARQRPVRGFMHEQLVVGTEVQRAHVFVTDRVVGG